MPLRRLKYTFDYCRPNPIGFLIILALIYSIDFINKYARYNRIRYQIPFYIIAFFLTVFIYGYGMVITKDTIRNGEKLPIIKLKQCTIYGIKTFILINIYSFIEGYILYLFSRMFLLPKFTLKYASTHIINTLKLYYAYNPAKTGEFILCSIIVTYILAFFMEISLARLADGGKILDALRLPSIKRCIDTIGWRHYIIDYTKILLAIMILGYLQYGIDYFGFFNSILDLIIGLLIFIIEFIGIGKIYQDYKIKKAKKRIEYNEQII